MYYIRSCQIICLTSLTLYILYDFREPYKLASCYQGSVLRSNICHMIQNDLFFDLIHSLTPTCLMNFERRTFSPYYDIATVIIVMYESVYYKINNRFNINCANYKKVSPMCSILDITMT